MGAHTKRERWVNIDNRHILRNIVIKRCLTDIIVEYQTASKYKNFVEDRTLATH